MTLSFPNTSAPDLAPRSSSPIEVILLGAGGHAKVVISTLHADHRIVRAAFDTEPLLAPTISQIQVHPETELFTTSVPKTLMCIAAIGDNHVREAATERHAYLTWTTAVHPKSVVDPSVELGPGTVVFAGTVVQPDARIGRHVIVNTAATVDHDCTLCNFVHIGPGAHLCGDVKIGPRTLIGAAAVVCPGVTIGEGVVVGAGAVVTGNLPDLCTVTGVPARPIGHD